MADYYFRKQSLYPDLEEEARDPDVDIGDISNHRNIASATILYMDMLGSILDRVIDKETSEFYEEQIRSCVKSLMVIADRLKSSVNKDTIWEQFKNKFAAIEKRFARYCCLDRYFFYHFIYGFPPNVIKCLINRL